MSFFKNRIVAACLLVAVIAGTTASSARNGLDEKAADVSSQFFYASQGKSIYGYLEDRADAASGLASIAERYDLTTLTEELKFEHGVMAGLIDRCYYDYDSMDDFYLANAGLTASFDALYQALIQEDLSENDRKAVEAYHTTFNGAQKMIGQSDYNEKVRKFQTGVADRFPAKVFMELFDIDEPELYAADDGDIENVVLSDRAAGHHEEDSGHHAE